MYEQIYNLTSMFFRSLKPIGNTIAYTSYFYLLGLLRSCYTYI